MADVKTMPVADLVKAYIEIRDKKAQLKAELTKQMQPYDTALYQIETEMLDRMQQTGVDSMKTSAGTAYRTTKTSVSVADKAAFLEFIVDKVVDALRNKENAFPCFDMLDLKANKTAVEGYLSEKDELPPGVNMRREEAVGFRRA